MELIIDHGMQCVGDLNPGDTFYIPQADNTDNLDYFYLVLHYSGLFDKPDNKVICVSFRDNDILLIDADKPAVQINASVVIRGWTQ